MEIKINTILNLKHKVGTEQCSVPTFSDSIVVVIDVLRASTTICAALFNGAKEVIPCTSIDVAKDKYSQYSKCTAILGGERNGIKPEGFDLGNSPSEYSREIVEYKTVILTTTNGTKALEKVKNAKEVLIGCFANISTVIEKLVNNSSDFTDVAFLCAGNDGKPTLEDALCAGALINKLINRYDNCYLNEVSKYALNTFLEKKRELLKECYKSEHGKRLIELGFKNDIDLALKFDIYPVDTVFKGGKIIIPLNPPL